MTIKTTTIAAASSSVTGYVNQTDSHIDYVKAHCALALTLSLSIFLALVLAHSNREHTAHSWNTTKTTNFFLSRSFLLYWCIKTVEFILVNWFQLTEQNFKLKWKESVPMRSNASTNEQMRRHYEMNITQIVKKKETRTTPISIVFKSNYNHFN